MLQFTYTNRGPKPWAIVRSNLIRLRWENGTLAYDRYYNCNTTKPPITHVFEGHPTPVVVAQAIHWGCCGWSANKLQLDWLIANIKDFVERGDGVPS